MLPTSRIFLVTALNIPSGVIIHAGLDEFDEFFPFGFGRRMTIYILNSNIENHNSAALE